MHALSVTARHRVCLPSLGLTPLMCCLFLYRLFLCQTILERGQSGGQEAGEVCHSKSRKKHGITRDRLGCCMSVPENINTSYNLPRFWMTK